MGCRVADSFQGGVDPGRAGRGELRARVAIHSGNVEALTGDETFRIPIARCSLARAGQKILVRDDQGSLVIWSDDEGFLDVLARAQRGTLKEQVGSLRGAKRRRRVLWSVGKAVIALVAVYAASVPFTRWGVRGGVPRMADCVGQSALKQLDLPSGVAPTVELQLSVIAEQLRPACPSSTRSFRVLLAGYAEAHSFSLPPDAVIVTSGLVCGADDPNLVTAAVALELGRLENRDVSHHVAEAVDWHTPLDLALGDVTKLRESMLDFADPKRSPGFTTSLEAAAGERALVMLTRVGVHLAVGQDVTSLMARLKQLPLAPAENAQPPPTVAAPAVKDGTLDWAKVRAEACNLIGR
jgi:hypothetical protein